jgi:hypothetical protein
MERKIEWRRWERRRKQLLDDHNKKRRYRRLKGEAIDRTLWRTWFGRGCGPVVRRTKQWIRIFILNKSSLFTSQIVSSESKKTSSFRTAMKEFWPDAIGNVAALSLSLVASNRHSPTSSLDYKHRDMWTAGSQLIYGVPKWKWDW